MRKIYNVRYGVQKIKTTADNFKAMAALTITGLVAAVAMPLATHAASSSVIVTPANTQGWAVADQASGGAVNYNNDTTGPGNPSNGALELTTDSTAASKIQYLHATNTALSDVTELSYYTKQNSASFVGGDASYQLPMCLNGVSGTTCNGFSTLVYEPYQGGQGAVVPGTWQQWNIGTTGLFWSSRSVTCANGTVTGVAGGPAIYTISDLQALCPSAVVVGFGVNVGSNNPSYDVEADLVDFNGTTYNFEPYQVATDKDACKNGGWQSLSAANGSSFKNQGACVSYVASNGESQH